MTAPTSTVRDLPDALPNVLPDDGRFAERLAGRRSVVFLDYDGVLTPIVNRPKDGVICDSMRDTVQALAQRCTVCVVSGRDRAVVEELMGVDDLVVAGSRGCDIWSPNGGEIQHDAASGFSDVVEATYRLRAEVVGWIPGVVVEPKRASVAMHYRTSVTDSPRRRAPCSPSPTGGRSCPARWSISSTRRSTGATPTTSRSPTGLRRRLRPLLPPEVE
jgi:trehalose 6-phosphate phosphatase